MGLKSHQPSLLIMILYLIISYNNFQASVGMNWRPLAVDSYNALEYGSFAVEEHNKLGHTNLKFESVVHAETLMTKGTLLVRLIIKAKDKNNKEKKYKVRVDDPVYFHFKRLVSFNETT